MKYRLLDVLACPICKTWPLELLVFEETKYRYENLPEKIPYCRDYCGLNTKKLSELDVSTLDCKSCISREVVEGILKCPSCNRWYPITEEIPIMLPDELRRKDEDLNFLKKWEAYIPNEIKKYGKPFHL